MSRAAHCAKRPESPSMGGELKRFLCSGLLETTRGRASWEYSVAKGFQGNG